MQHLFEHLRDVRHAVFLFLEFGHKQDPVTSQEAKDKTVERKHGRRITERKRWPLAACQ